MTSSCRVRSLCGAADRSTDVPGVVRDVDDLRTRRVVGAARAGDREAMAELYVLHAAVVHAYVLRVVKDRDDADDVTQQVFAKLLTGLDRYRPQETPFVGWVLSVARNSAIDHLRRRRAVPVDRLDERPAPDERRAGETRRALQAALAGLPQGQREVLVLTHVAGLAPHEIAGILGRTVRAVHGLHYRGRAALRVALTDLGSAPVVVRPPARP